MKQNISAYKLLKKQVMDIADGAYKGVISQIVVDPECFMVTGVVVTNVLQQPAFLALISITNVTDDMVVVKEFSPKEVLAQYDLLKKSVITQGGHLIGEVVDFAFDRTTGDLSNVLLSGSFVRTAKVGAACLDRSGLALLGQEALISVYQDISDVMLAEPDEHCYDKRNTETTDAFAQEQNLAFWLGRLEEITRDWRSSPSLQKFGEEVGKKIQGFFATPTDNTKSTSAQPSADEDDLIKVANDLANYTVAENLFSLDGAQLLLSPGDVITREVLEILRKEKRMDQLYRVLTLRS